MTHRLLVYPWAEMHDLPKALTRLPPMYVHLAEFAKYWSSEFIDDGQRGAVMDMVTEGIGDNYLMLEIALKQFKEKASTVVDYPRERKVSSS